MKNVSIGTDVLNRKEKVRPKQHLSKEDEEEKEELRKRLEQEENSAKFPRELKSGKIPGEATEASPEKHPFGVVVDAQQGKVVIAGGRRQRRSRKRG